MLTQSSHPCVGAEPGPDRAAPEPGRAPRRHSPGLPSCVSRRHPALLPSSPLPAPGAPVSLWVTRSRLTDPRRVGLAPETRPAASLLPRPCVRLPCASGFSRCPQPHWVCLSGPTASEG